MKLHRFYIPDLELKQTLWLQQPELLRQWSAVLRFRPGQQVVLFDGKRQERLYKLVAIDKHEAQLAHVTDMVPKLPKRDITLLWALLTKDKNDWVLQKATELGVKHFVPLITERTTKTGFNVERARRIIIEAVEQCGRGDVPSLREPLQLVTAITELRDKLTLHVCEAGGEGVAAGEDNIGILVGPEGGWSDDEKRYFHEQKLTILDLHDFTLRAETAAIAAALKLLQ